MSIPQHRDTSKDVHCREATLVWDADLKGFPLPGHTKKCPRLVKTETQAFKFAQRIDVEIGKRK